MRPAAHRGSNGTISDGGAGLGLNHDRFRGRLPCRGQHLFRPHDGLAPALSTWPIPWRCNTARSTGGWRVSFAAGNTAPILGGLSGGGNIALADSRRQGRRAERGQQRPKHDVQRQLERPGSLIKQGPGTLTLTASAGLRRSDSHQRRRVAIAIAISIHRPGPAGTTISIHLWVMEARSPVPTAAVPSHEQLEQLDRHILHNQALIRQQRPGHLQPRHRRGLRTSRQGAGDQLLNGYISCRAVRSRRLQRHPLRQVTSLYLYVAGLVLPGMAANRAWEARPTMCSPPMPRPSRKSRMPTQRLPDRKLRGAQTIFPAPPARDRQCRHQ